jgi:hypothetical protein
MRIKADYLRFVAVASIFAATVTALFAGSWYVLDRILNPLKRLGVTYEIQSGEHAEFQNVQFFYQRGQSRVEGPIIYGEDLNITYRRVRNEPFPEIVVGSDVDERRSTVLKLNLTDPKKPEFELVATNMGVAYYPPWGEYYKRNEATDLLLPIPNSKK